MKVYKYRGGNFDRDIKTLADDYYWAPTSEELNDPFEALVHTDSYYNEIDQLLLFTGLSTQPGVVKSAESLINAVENFCGFGKSAGIYSLSKSYKHELLWAHYADGHKGFCIEYDLEKLIEQNKHEYEVIDVDYQATPPKFAMRDMESIKTNKLLLYTKLLGTKSMPWAYEQETRVLTSKAGAHNYDYRAVTGIYFGARMKNEHRCKIQKSLKGRGIKYFQMSLDGVTYELSESEVADEYRDADKYLYSISPIIKDAIDLSVVKDVYKMHSDYLYKAAEVIRRDPYCEKVLMVDFSADSTPDTPIVFVQIETTFQEFPKNYYFSFQEIDAAFKTIDDL